MAKMPPQLFNEEITAIHVIAKQGTEEQVRGLLIDIPARINQLEQAYDMDFDSSFYVKKHKKLEIKYLYMAMTALRASLARHNRIRKDKQRARQVMNITPQTLAVLLETINTAKSLVKNNNMTELKSQVDISVLGKPVVTGDIQADEALNSIREKILAGQELKEIADKAKEAKPGFSFNDLFKPGEDGTVDL